MRLLLRFPAALAAAALAGCAGPPPAETIRASDGGAFQPVVRASKSLSRLSGPPSDPQSGHAIEFGFTQGSGSSTQSFGSGYVAFGSKTFNAPDNLAYEFDFRYIDVSYRWRQFFGAGRSFGYEALAGVAISELDFTVRSASQRANEGMSSPGVAVGAGVLWRLRPGIGVQLRGAGFFSGDDNGVTRATRLDLFFVQALGSNVALRAGYSSWSLESERGGTTSPIEVDFRGPALGLDVMF